ncbi:hypothetical protein Ssi02_54190 [Sinosporangium siamense]|uniref:Zinc-binding dehydrogenase n=1 Tax=Sinosporangium siamense TaxID=1367973 RepID=A0A919RK05_9ACTN|nr:hypothetical protein Ssi02_54190 [Sinosporangium siamense]
MGGNLLAEAFGALEDGGVALSIGWASREPIVIDFEEERMKGVLKRLEPFTVAAPFGLDLAYLIHLLEKGELDPQIGWRGPWERVDEAIDALLGRRVQGKAVLDLILRDPADPISSSRGGPSPLGDGGIGSGRAAKARACPGLSGEHIGDRRSTRTLHRGQRSCPMIGKSSF